MDELDKLEEKRYSGDTEAVARLAKELGPIGPAGGHEVCQALGKISSRISAGRIRVYGLD